jgi:hypothetical protein
MIFTLSCAPSVKFPVSNITPDAHIKAHAKKDKHKNSLIFIKAYNLARANILDSTKSVYVVWIDTKGNGTSNIGYLENKKGKKAALRTITPYEPKEIFITAESSGNITQPAGIEISRIMIYFEGEK